MSALIRSAEIAGAGSAAPAEIARPRSDEHRISRGVTGVPFDGGGTDPHRYYAEPGSARTSLTGDGPAHRLTGTLPLRETRRDDAHPLVAVRDGRRAGRGARRGGRRRRRVAGGGPPGGPGP